MATSSMQIMNLCETCKHSTVHLVQKTSCNHVLHLLLSVFTGGGWLIIWVLCAMSQGESRPVCTVCGTRVKDHVDHVAWVAILILTAFVVMAMCLGRYWQPHASGDYPAAVPDPTPASQIQDQRTGWALWTGPSEAEKAANWQHILDMRKAERPTATATPTPDYAPRAELVPRSQSARNRLLVPPTAQEMATEPVYTGPGPRPPTPEEMANPNYLAPRED
jgi:hypothetical protein